MRLLLSVLFLGVVLIKFNEGQSYFNSETGSCSYGLPGVSICAGECNVRNSKCEMVIDTDMLYCGCTYCNYDASTNQCGGKCQNRQTGKCINRVKEPKSDSDCGCFTCTKSVSSSGQVVCGGTCFESGLSCKPITIAANTLSGFSVECVCQ